MRRVQVLQLLRWSWLLALACGLAVIGACGSGSSDESAESYWSVVVADFDGDGLMDVAASSSGDGSPPHPGTVAVFLQDRAALGRFLPPDRLAVGNDPVAMTTGDFDSDGHVDIATYNTILATSGAGVRDVSVLLQLPTSAGRFQPALSCFPVWIGPHTEAESTRCAELALPGDFRDDDVVLADLNGDGLADQVTAHFGTISSPCEAFNCSIVGARVSVALQDPASPGRYLSPTDYRGSDFISGVAVADLNRDGRPDLVIAQTGGLYIRYQDPTHPGQFMAQVRFDR
jgi:hypothetical protein